MYGKHYNLSICWFRCHCLLRRLLSLKLVAGCFFSTLHDILTSAQAHRVDGPASGSAKFMLEPTEELKAARQTASRMLRNDSTESSFILIIEPITVVDVLNRGLLELTHNLNPSLRSSISAIRGILPRKEGKRCYPTRVYTSLDTLLEFSFLYPTVSSGLRPESLVDLAPVGMPKISWLHAS